MEGILVGCDRHQEWLLTWWWNHLTKHNRYPVAFIDFGMTKKAAAWCRERGSYFALPSAPYPLKTPSQKGWRSSSAMRLRSVWFKKTEALLLSPFPLSAWIDLDCEIRGKLDPLFAFLSRGTDIALAREPECFQRLSQEAKANLPGEVAYNGGVIVYRQGAKILCDFQRIARSENDLFQSDSEALSRAVFRMAPSFAELPSLFNWQVYQGTNPEALILHYVSATKRAILLQMDCRQFVKPKVAPSDLSADTY